MEVRGTFQAFKWEQRPLLPEYAAKFTRHPVHRTSKDGIKKWERAVGGGLPGRMKPTRSLPEPDRHGRATRLES